MAAAMEGAGAAEMASPWEVRLDMLKTALKDPPTPARIHRVRHLKVPASVKQANPDSYTPRFLYLGFLNRPDPQKQEGLDRLKVSWARQFLAWVKAKETGGATVEDMEDEWSQFVRSLEIDVEHAHALYKIQPALKPEAVANVLALDAVFVCLFLLDWRQFEGADGSALFAQFFGPGKVVRLPEFESGGISASAVARDLLLLENQLPLYILQRVCQRAGISFSHVVAQFLFMAYGRLFHGTRENHYLVIDGIIRQHILGDENDETSGDGDVLDEFSGNDHLLHCFLKLVCYAPPSSDGKYYHLPTSFAGSKYANVSPASLLHSAGSKYANVSPASLMKRDGIRFTTGSGKDSLIFIHQIRFDKSASQLLLPSICIDGMTEVLLRNLIACEAKTHNNTSVTPLASYLGLLDDLINNEEDVDLLSSLGVLHTQHVGTTSEACEVWNRLGAHRLTNCQSIFFREVIEAVNKRRRSFLFRRWAEFKKTYFSRPWYTVSFLAAFVLLLLTIAQTVYTVLPYYNQ